MRFDDAVAAYRSRGYKITPQRLAVMRALVGDATHPTAAAVVERVRRDFPFVSAATVYRVLEELVALGEILALDLGNGRMRYDPNTSEHAHLVCEVCGRVEDVDWRLAADVLPPDRRRGYEVSGVRVVFNGRCPVCLEGGDGGGSASPASR